MKKLFSLIGPVLFVSCSIAQSVDNKVTLKDLAVPNSPAFIITDITPTLIQTPSTPKSFILGIAQSFQQSSDGFPQNYSAEFAPYWWFNPKNRNVYTMLGFKTKLDADNNVVSIDGANPWAGLKFASFSLAFLNKDLIPDTVKSSQKVFSIGMKTTVLKFYLKAHSDNLKNKISAWHKTALNEIDLILDQIAAFDRDSASVSGDATLTSQQKKQKTDELMKKKADLLKQSVNIKTSGTREELIEINDIINEKPIFSLDIAGAYAVYGIGDSTWRSGRSGIWTTFSSYIPLALSADKVNKNYFNLNFSLRYLFDNYHKNEKGIIEKSSSIDLGGKIALEFDKLSVGVESLYRFNNGVANSQNRTVGVINYKVADNIYITGAFGRNFDNPNKLISLFGINWGFGTETVNLPVTK